MNQVLAKVVFTSPALPKLFAPDEDAARRFIEFFTAPALCYAAVCSVLQGRV